ncbi:Sec-independent protein translocase subunit TatA/TatB [Brumimicrobium mesophilum]|uniref:Sec-independent protein translocase subunit TatA/TatB n=1 Tax=Brumimicrobium mesophilum TaxID=392717 RepID=UPI000D141BC2|nr:twin-arginine translocase TatA/TatE family subunit [Brumimicrobium mesophilum]
MLLFINSIAGSEILVILLFVLIFFGAKSIPGMARGLGKGIRQIKDASQDIQDEIRKTTSDMQRDMNVNRALHDAKNKIEAPIQNFKKDIENSASGIKKNVNGILNDGGEKSLENTMEAPIKDFSNDLKASADQINKNINSESKPISKVNTSSDNKIERKSDQENNS